MLKNYFKIAIRSLLKNKVYSFLNISGLSVGMAACLLIFQYVSREVSYDKFHEDYENIYRIQYNFYKEGRTIFECAAAVPAVGPFMKENLPEVLEFSRAYPFSGVVTRGEVNFREEKLQYATPSFIQMFDWGMVKGNPETALTGPDKAVISERAAQKYFGSEDPMGKFIRLGADQNFEVRGVFKDVPENSHLKFDILLSFETLNQLSDNQSETHWGWYDHNTYVKIKPGTDIKSLQAKFDPILASDRAERWSERNYEQAFLFQPLKDIHLYSDLLQESEPDEQGDAQAVYFLSIIAIFILVIAWVNYVNLSTSRSLDRAREVGVRKVLGAVKKQLVRQFILESLVINVIAGLIAIIAVALILPSFNDFTGTKVPFALLDQPRFWVGLTALFVMGSLLSGLYPAFILSSFKPAVVLKGKLAGSQSGVTLRKGLVVFQFASSVALIAGTIIVYQQLNFMRSQDLGVDIKETLVIKGPGVFGVDSLYGGFLNTFRNEVLRNPNISNITTASNVPGDEIFWTNGAKKAEDPQDSYETVYIVGMDDQYIPTFQLELLSGRNFDKSFGNEEQSVILNEASMRQFGFANPEEAIGRRVMLGNPDNVFSVVGVVKNFNQMSLKSSVSPLFMRYLPSGNTFFSLKIEPDSYRETLSQVQSTYNSIFPGNPFDYFFLDEFFNRQYANEDQFGVVFGMFSGLAIFVACLGLFGLSAFSALQRTKEIGVRKVLGASVANIMLLLSKEFIILIAIANVLAWPVTYLIMNDWLQGFAYRMDIPLWLFLISGLLVIVIALITVSYRTFVTARANPVNALKYE